MNNIAERFRWAVEKLDVAPSDRVLEIGCGPGVAVSLICETLSLGRIVAIDRSNTMVDQAVRRNRKHVDEGRAAFKAVALNDATFEDERFDKVFAINVRLFPSGGHDRGSRTAARPLPRAGSAAARLPP